MNEDPVTLMSQVGHQKIWIVRSIQSIEPFNGTLSFLSSSSESCRIVVGAIRFWS